MTHEDFRLLISILQWAISCAAAIYAWNASRQTARAAVVAALDRRVLLIEEQLRHMPAYELVHELHGDLKAVKAELVGVKKSFDPIARGLDRINEYLLNHKK